MLSLVHLIYMAGDKCMCQNACFFLVGNINKKNLGDSSSVNLYVGQICTRMPALRLKGSSYQKGFKSLFLFVLWIWNVKVAIDND